MSGRSHRDLLARLTGMHGRSVGLIGEQPFVVVLPASTVQPVGDIHQFPDIWGHKQISGLCQGVVNQTHG